MVVNNFKLLGKSKVGSLLAENEPRLYLDNSDVVSLLVFSFGFFLWLEAFKTTYSEAIFKQPATQVLSRAN